MATEPNQHPTSTAQTLHAPWRMSYMDMLSRQQGESQGAKPEPADSAGPPCCFLREYWLNPQSDAANHVIVRTGTEGQGSGGLVMLNKYPYANGHLLVCLGEGRQRLLDYSEAQRAELWSLTDLAVDLVERTLECQGVNVGVNQGMAAGAGVPEHVHVHVVPRWSGDVNFISVVAQIRVIPSALEAMARRFGDVWSEMAAGTP